MRQHTQVLPTGILAQNSCHLGAPESEDDESSKVHWVGVFADEASIPPHGDKKEEDTQTCTRALKRHLVLHVEGRPKEIYWLDAGTFSVGRGSKNDLILEESCASRRHFLLNVEDERVVISDQSANGTLVNGSLVEKQVLSDGDRIEVGRSLLLFRANVGSVVPSIVTRRAFRDHRFRAFNQIQTRYWKLKARHFYFSFAFVAVSLFSFFAGNIFHVFFKDRSSAEATVLPPPRAKDCYDEEAISSVQEMVEARLGESGEKVDLGSIKDRWHRSIQLYREGKKSEACQVVEYIARAQEVDEQIQLKANSFFTRRCLEK